MRIFIILLLFSLTTQAQILSGTVRDSLQLPLQHASIVAHPKSDDAEVKFIISDKQGHFRLSLQKGVSYSVRISFLGFEAQTFDFTAVEDLHKNITLKESTETLDEIIITQKYEPIIVKKDTVAFRVDAFTSGTERKLKEQLEKLPGVEVDRDGIVHFQGKQVNILTVENKPFFGGGTKLGVENIPADAVEKVEFIDRYNSVGFMKEVSDSDQLSMNIQLKEDKKKFLFGDVQAGLGNAPFYLGHAALFYYAPKINFGYIGNLNNFGERVFSFEDLTRFQGGLSSYTNQRRQGTNLFSFGMRNNDVVENKSQFHALNLNYNFSKNWDVSGFVIFSDVLRRTKSITDIEYLLIESEENRINEDRQKTVLGMTNWKLNWNSKKNTKWIYDVSAESSTNDFSNVLNSFQTQNNTNQTFNALRDAEQHSVKQYFERHQRHNAKSTTTAVVNHVFTNDVPTQTWLTNQPFLPGLIPLEEDDFYQIKQLKKRTSNTVDALFKHYYLLNNFNHIYTAVGVNFEQTRLLISENQRLSDGSVNDFAENGFGNHLNYQMQDYFLGLEYKFKWGKLTAKPMIYFHKYLWNTTQEGQTRNFERLFAEPQLIADFERNSAEKVALTYKLTNQFPRADLMLSRFTLQNFNAVFRGNELLENEQFHHATLDFTKNNVFAGWFFSSKSSITHKTSTIRNAVELQGIDQFTTPLLTQNPETYWNSNNRLTYNIPYFRVIASVGMSAVEYIQEINSVEQTNQRLNQRMGLGLQTIKRKWPYFFVMYTHGFNQFRGVNRSDFKSQSVDFRYEQRIFKDWSLKTDYQWSNVEFSTGANVIQLWNASLSYQQNNSPWTFEIRSYNLLNVERRFNTYLSDFMILQQEIFLLPRVVLFSVNYKL